MKVRPRFIVALMIAIAVTAGISLWDSSPAPTEAVGNNSPDPQALEYVSSAEARNPEDERKGFRLPPGFEIQLFASEPDIGKPLNMAFDARGRLWVTQSSHYPFPASQGEGRDKLTILEDTNGDGRADEFTTFASNLNIPLGILPDRNGAIVYSIPHVYRLSDTDGDGRADDRKILYGPFGHRDTHGMVNNFVRGFDGWIYVCHGYNNTSEVRGADGHTIRMTSGNVFRMKPDGSRVEIFTTGQVNPFGLAFDPRGNLYSADCHSGPLYQLLKGGDYPHFNKLPSGIGFGPTMMVHGHHSTAIAGIAYYAAEQFPDEYRDNIFIGNVVTNRVNRDVLIDRGSTRVALEKPDFIVSDDPWFRPVNLQVGPDGALYIADFYNRIIGHYEVPLNHPGRDRHRGRIWRVVYTGVDSHKEPAPRRDWSQASIDELLEDLANTNLAVRMLAMHQLADRVGTAAVGPIRSLLASDRATVQQKIHGLWVLRRLNALEEKTLEDAVKSSDAGIRTHAMRILSELTPLPAAGRDWALAGLRDPDSFVQRTAAQILRVHPDNSSLLAVLDQRHQAPATDTHLTYVLRMALRDHLRQEKLLAETVQTDWSEEEAHLLADVMIGVEDTQAARFLLDHVQKHDEDNKTLVPYVKHAAGLLSGSELENLAAFCRSRSETELSERLMLFRALEEGTTARLPSALREWAIELMNALLESEQDEHVISGFQIAGSLRWRPLETRLRETLDSKQAPTTVRSAAADSLAAMSIGKHVALMSRILNDADEPGELRSKMSSILGRVNSRTAREQVIQAASLAPKRLQTSFAAALLNRKEGASALLDAISEGKLSPLLLLETSIEMRFKAFDDARLNQRLAELTRDIQPVDVRRESLRSKRETFDPQSASPQLGAAVFDDQCANCHQIAGKGETVAPQLDGIGRRGLERIIEDIIYPSQNVDEAFATTIVHLKNSTIASGLLVREEPTRVVLLDEAGEEFAINRDEIETMRKSPLSPMPADLADRIPSEEFQHLLAFLLEQR